MNFLCLFYIFQESAFVMINCWNMRANFIIFKSYKFFRLIFSNWVLFLRWTFDIGFDLKIDFIDFCLNSWGSWDPALNDKVVFLKFVKSVRFTLRIRVKCTIWSFDNTIELQKYFYLSSFLFFFSLSLLSVRPSGKGKKNCLYLNYSKN